MGRTGTRTAHLLQPDAAVAAIARPQHGAVSSAQARSAGMTWRMISTRTAQGRWVQHAPQVFTLAGSPSTDHQRLWIGALAGGAAAVISHRSAAGRHGLVTERLAAVVHITVPYGSNARGPRGVRIHRSRCLPDHHITQLDGLPITSVARTVIDVAHQLPDDRLAAVVDAATDHRSGLRALDVAAAMGEVGFGRRGMVRLMTILDRQLHRPAASELERRLDDLIIAAGLPAPVREAPHPHPERRHERVDRLFPDARLIVEADGRSFHDRRRQMSTDRARDNAANAAGHTTNRYMWEQVVGDPGWVIENLRATHAANLAGDHAPTRQGVSTARAPGARSAHTSEGDQRCA